MYPLHLQASIPYENALARLPMSGQRLGGIGVYRTETGQPRFNNVHGAYTFDTYLTTYSYVNGQYSFALIIAISLSETLSVSDALGVSVSYAVALSEVLNASDSMTLYRAMPVSLAETLSVSDAYVFQGVYGLVLPESLVFGDTASTNAALVAYAVNQTTGAVTTYNNFNINSFAKLNGRFYGMTDAGIVELTGDTDNGAEIPASVKFGTSELSTDIVPAEVMKRLPTVYLGVTAAGDMILRVTANGATNTYTLAEVTNTSLHTGRLILGKGVKSRYWDFELVNSNGADFTLESITLHPVALGRRIVEG